MQTQLQCSNWKNFFFGCLYKLKLLHLGFCSQILSLILRGRLTYIAHVEISLFDIHKMDSILSTHSNFDLIRPDTILLATYIRVKVSKPLRC